MERVLIAFSAERIRQRIVCLLSGEGWETTVCLSGAEVIRTARQLGGAAVLCGFYLPDMTADALAAELRGTAALLVLAKAAYLDLCGGENLYKLPLPASRAELLASLHMLLNAEGHRLYHPVSRRKEEETALIRRAKELLMDVNRMTEEEAHRFLQKRSMDQGLRMAEAAQYILDSHTL